MSKIEEVFGRPRVFLPVIHLPLGEVGGWRAIETALLAGADGVLLINQGMNIPEVLNFASAVRERYPTLWLGVNLLGMEPGRAAEAAVGTPGCPDGVWADDAGVDARDEATYELAKASFARARAEGGFAGLYFGGVAFKTQEEIPFAELPAVAQRAATFVDVVTTSGRATGVAASVDRVKAIRDAIPGVPLGLASGVRPENIQKYLPYVQAYLVASGIEISFGVLDPIRTRAVADSIRGG